MPQSGHVNPRENGGESAKAAPAAGWCDHRPLFRAVITQDQWLLWGTAKERSFFSRFDRPRGGARNAVERTYMRAATFAPLHHWQENDGRLGTLRKIARAHPKRQKRDDHDKPDRLCHGCPLIEYAPGWPSVLGLFGQQPQPGRAWPPERQDADPLYAPPGQGKATLFDLEFDLTPVPQKPIVFATLSRLGLRVARVSQNEGQRCSRLIPASNNGQLLAIYVGEPRRV